MLLSKNLKNVFILIILLQLGCVAQGRNTAIKYLMNEPFTLWDWCISQLKQELKNMSSSFQYDDNYKKLISDSPSINVDYNSNSNNLEISVFTSHKFETEQEAKDWCVFALEKIKTKFGLDPKTGNFNPGRTPETKKFLENWPSWLGGYFEHEGSWNKTMTKNFRNELDKITKIFITVYNSEGDKPLPATVLECESPLRGGTPIFSKKKINKAPWNPY